MDVSVRVDPPNTLPTLEAEAGSLALTSRNAAYGSLAAAVGAGAAALVVSVKGLVGCSRPAPNGDAADDDGAAVPNVVVAAGAEANELPSNAEKGFAAAAGAIAGAAEKGLDAVAGAENGLGAAAVNVDGAVEMLAKSSRSDAAADTTGLDGGAAKGDDDEPNASIVEGVGVFDDVPNASKDAPKPVVIVVVVVVVVVVPNAANPEGAVDAGSPKVAKPAGATVAGAPKAAKPLLVLKASKPASNDCCGLAGAATTAAAAAAARPWEAAGAAEAAGAIGEVGLAPYEYRWSGFARQRKLGSFAFLRFHVQLARASASQRTSS